jgi:phosphonate transport system permease protein
MNSVGDLKSAMLADRTGIEKRHPNVFRPDWGGRTKTGLILAVLLGLLIYGLASMDTTWTRIFSGFGELVRILSVMLPPTFGTEAKLLVYLKALGETLAIALLGTLLAAVLAFPLGILAARNVLPVWLARFILRRSFDTIRGVDALIWALVWINVVGLGPFAGVLAIATSDIGSFAKLFSEAVENSDRKPVEGVLASGGGHVHAVRYGLIPQVLPVIAGQVLYFIESNTRSATIIGIVGAGGIGLHLAEQIRTLEWQHVSFLVLMILVAVALIDVISTRLRSAIIGRRAS